MAIEMIIKNQREKRSQEQYKLVLMDCNMPVMDGYLATQILLEKIRKGTLNALTIAACTADLTQGNVAKCNKIGFSTILFKPIERKKLKRYIETSLEII